jgi:hypothetical protein
MEIFTGVIGIIAIVFNWIVDHLKEVIESRDIVVVLLIIIAYILHVISNQLSTIIIKLHRDRDDG